jgi:hypothetical protein
MTRVLALLTSALLTVGLTAGTVVPATAAAETPTASVASAPRASVAAVAGVTAEFVPMCHSDGTNRAGAIVTNRTANAVTVRIEFNGGRPDVGPFQVAAGETYSGTFGLTEDTTSEVLVWVDGQLILNTDLEAECADNTVPTFVTPYCVGDAKFVDINVVNLTDSPIDVAVDFEGASGRGTELTVAPWNLDGMDPDIELIGEPITADANTVSIRVDYDRDGRIDETVFVEEFALDCGVASPDSVGANLLESVCVDGANRTTIELWNDNAVDVDSFELTVGDDVRTVSVPAESSLEVHLALPEDRTSLVTVLFPDGAGGFRTLLEEEVPVDCVPVPKALTPTPVPKISGTPNVGSTLTVSRGTWGPGTVSFTYQWYRNGVAVAKATSSSYKLTSSDAGSAITVRVVGSKSGYTSVGMTSAPLSVRKVLTTKTPTISGTAAVGKTLTAKSGTWGPGKVTLKYQWYRSGTAISRASSSTYRLVAADAGKKITVKVTGSRSGYTTASKTSSATTIGKVLTATPTPKISGTAAVGKTLTAKAGTWGPGTVKLKYQWYRNGAAISKATGKSYRLVSADRRKSITVKVTGSRSGYTSVSKSSAPKTVR